MKTFEKIGNKMGPKDKKKVRFTMRKSALMVFSAGIGGAESVVKEVFAHLLLLKEDIVVITCDEIADVFREINPVRVLSIGKLYNNSFFSKGYRFLLYKLCNKLFKNKDLYNRLLLKKHIKKIAKIICSENISIVHAHLMQAIYCLSKCKTDAVKMATIHDAHGLDNMGFDELAYQTVKDMYEQMDIVTAACNYFFDLFRNNNINLKMTFIVENGINAAALKTVIPRNFDADKFHIIFLGGDREVKGCDYLEQATKICVKEFKIYNICVHVLRNVSEASSFYHAVVRDGLQEYFDIVGYVEGGKHLEYMAAADLYILPSRTEGAANTLLEAIGLNLCILATNVGGTPELIEDGVNGYLAKMDARDIANRIKRLYSDILLRRRLADANKMKSEKYDWNIISEKYKKIYHCVRK
ncbi:glycosyltransferase family 4 protein [Acetivibrio sp. MSJd-27]|uniref:glycosyltransferase family 4 protein n=1 Tax=Acetivibrio sp. MSJd-27 TaxID=2841523 RepID=UPI001C0FDEEF|nr:glycosyltransferase family 4 protein [Acetivibrio sp. MSJd-27]MBU5450127.1 glycosyltransferase family 4 protein [Acetivibrio sp. MSJd-27]